MLGQGDDEFTAARDLFTCKAGRIGVGTIDETGEALEGS